MQKYLPTFLLALLVICCDNEQNPEPEPEPEPACQLTEISTNVGSAMVRVAYTYKANGQMDTQVRTNNGNVFYSYTYTFGADGKVSKVDMGDSYMKFEYNSSGEIKSVKTFTSDDVLSRTQEYTWSGNKVEIRFSLPNAANPYQITEYEFQNGNTVKERVQSYQGSTLTFMTESTFEDFDTSLSPYFVAGSARPGYTTGVSRNNPRKQTVTSKSLSEGELVEDPVTNITFEYTYTAFGAMATSKRTVNGQALEEATATYLHCD